MRKEFLLPVVASAGGAAGFFLRRWELATAFEPETGLHIPFAPASLVLLLFTLGMAAALLLLSRGAHSSFPGGYGQAFGAAGNTVCLTAVVLAAFLLLGSAVLHLMGLPADYRAAVEAAQLAAESGQPAPPSPLLVVLPRGLMGGLCLLSFFALLAIGRGNFRDTGEKKRWGWLLVPAYTCGLWLIQAYQQRAGDPVVLDYLYELFAIIAVLLALYLTASFSFERIRVFWASLFSGLGIYFSLLTMADGHPYRVTLLYGFAAIYLAAQLSTLHRNDLIYRDALPAAAESQDQPDTEEEEGETPDE